MLRSCTPSGAASATKSPSLLGAAQPPYTGPFKKFLRSSTLCVKPPVAKITAFFARNRSVAPSSSCASTPITRPAAFCRILVTRVPVRMAMPSCRAFADIVRTATRPPSDMLGAASAGTSTRPLGALSSGSSAK